MPDLSWFWTGESMNLTREYSRSQLEETIREWINGDKAERNRKLVRLKLFKGVTFEEAAELCKMSPKQARVVFHRCEEVLLRHLPGK